MATSSLIIIAVLSQPEGAIIQDERESRKVQNYKVVHSSFLITSTFCLEVEIGVLSIRNADRSDFCEEENLVPRDYGLTELFPEI